MSDQTSEVLHKTMKAMVATAPEAPDLTAIPTAPATRRRSPMLVAATAFAFVLAVGTFTFFLGGDGSTVGAYPAAASAEAQGVSLDFVFGPEPQFDTSTLGVEMVPEAGDSAIMLDEAAVVEAAQGMNPDYQMVGTPWYVGHLGGIHGFVVDFSTPDGSEMSCQILARSATRQGIGCSPPMESGMAATFNYSEDSPGLEVVIATADPNISVVSVQLVSGERYWQRPTRGLALFVIEDGTGSDGFTVSTHDFAGNIIGTESTNA